MQARTRHTLRLTGTATLAFVHVWFAGLAFADLLSFTQPSRFNAIQLAADSRAWGWLFASAGVILIIVLARGAEKHALAASRACSASAAMLGTWSFFTLLWGLTTDYPVSLEVFGPAVFSVVGAQILAISWAHKERPTT